jgi:hypothetical protein
VLLWVMVCAVACGTASLILVRACRVYCCGCCGLLRFVGVGDVVLSDVAATVDVVVCASLDVRGCVCADVPVECCCRCGLVEE